MHHFQVKKGELFAEDVPLSKLADTYGTPLYVYSASTITDHFDRLTAALAPLDHLICYAVKANSNLAILNLLAKRGSGFDLVSGGELTRVLKAGDLVCLAETAMGKEDLVTPGKVRMSDG